MKKQFLNLGKALNKAEQKQINGGAGGCPTYEECVSNCYNGGYCSELIIGEPTDCWFCLDQQPIE